MDTEKWNEEIKKRHMDIVADFRSERYKILPIVSSILVGLLAISFSNDHDLVKNLLLFKISLTGLIMLIPVSLLFFLRSFRYEEVDMLAKFKKITTENNEYENRDKSLLKSITLYSPWLISVLLLVGVVGIGLSFFFEELPFICL